MNTKEKIEIMQAYLNGAKIEKKSKHLRPPHDYWVDCNEEPEWAFQDNIYRVKKNS